MGQPEVTVPIGLFLSKEITVKGSFRYGVRHLILNFEVSRYLPVSLHQSGDYRLAIALAAQGKINLKPMVTHRYCS